MPLGLLVLLAALTVLMAVSHTLASRESQGWIAHTDQVMDLNQRVLAGLQEAENHARSYVLTGDECYRRPMGRPPDRSKTA